MESFDSWGAEREREEQKEISLRYEVDIGGEVTPKKRMP